MTETVSEEERQRALHVSVSVSEEGIATFLLRGELVGSDIVYFRRACAKTEKQGVVLFLIEFSEVESIDGYGLASLVGLLGRLRAVDGRMILCGLNPDLRAKFEDTHCTTIFETEISAARAEEKLREFSLQ